LVSYFCKAIFVSVLSIRQEIFYSQRLFKRLLSNY